MHGLQNIEMYDILFCFIPVLQKKCRNIHELYNYRHLYLPDVTKEIFYMPNTNLNDVGDKIKDAVDSAISTGDFTNLSRSIGDVINDTIDTVKDSVKNAAQPNQNPYSSNPYYKTVHTRPAPDQPQTPVLYNKRPVGRQVPSSAWLLVIPLEFSHWQD